MIKTITSSILLLWLTALPAQPSTSALPEGFEKKIDSFFSTWQNPELPGYSAAIIFGKEVVYKKSFGLADLNSKRAISSKTMFHVGELSHQFLVFGLFLLEEQGLVSTEDALKNYFPEFEKFGAKLKVKHLLMHSSGLYDYRVLKNVASWKQTDILNQNELLKLINAQQKLSFEPGEDYAYSFTNIALLGQLMEKVSGKPLQSLLFDKVFAPLEMKNSHWVQQASFFHQDLALPYSTVEEQLVHMPISDWSLGGGNLYISIDDMIKWEMHLMAPKICSKAIIDKLRQVITLNSGRSYRVPAGNMMFNQLFVHKERGMDNVIYRTGNAGGFTSSMFKFLDQGFTAMVFHNDGTPYNGYLCMESAYLFLEDQFPEPATTDYKKLATLELTPKALSTYEGHYWDALGELSRELKVTNDTLRYIRSNGYISPLVPLKDGRFQMKVEWDDKIYLNFENTGMRPRMTFTFGEAEPIPFVKYDPVLIEKQTLASNYAGVYFNTETVAAYVLEARDTTLVAKNSGRIEMSFRPITNSIFQGDQWYMGSIEFSFDEKGRTTGFFVRNNAIRNLWFERIR